MGLGIVTGICIYRWLTPSTLGTEVPVELLQLDPPPKEHQVFEQKERNIRYLWFDHFNGSYCQVEERHGLVEVEQQLQMESVSLRSERRKQFEEKETQKKFSCSWYGADEPLYCREESRTDEETHLAARNGRRSCRTSNVEAQLQNEIQKDFFCRREYTSDCALHEFPEKEWTSAQRRVRQQIAEQEEKRASYKEKLAKKYRKEYDCMGKLFPECIEEEAPGCQTFDDFYWEYKWDEEKQRQKYYERISIEQQKVTGSRIGYARFKGSRDV